MRVARTIPALRLALSPGRIGLVPTMGSFHEGHLSLMQAARAECNVVVVSLFVNPAQFGPNDDLKRYPRDEERDVRLAEEAGVDVLFIPSVETMYPKGFGTWVEVEDAGGEGAARPDHFRGVATVCLKLFNIVRPDVAFFGQKDAQQTEVIRRMVRDLELKLNLRVLPTVRDENGLALSSRNAYLSAEERQLALALPHALEAGRSAHAAGSDPVAAARAALNGLEPDYVELIDLEAVTVLAAAVRIGPTRLLDNVVLEGDLKMKPGKLTLHDLADLNSRGEKIVMVTAYDAPGARFAEQAGVDILLVGDTAGMVVLGHDGTVPVTMDEMLFLTRAVSGAVERPLVVGDMPFGSYHVSDEDAVRNAIRFVKEAGADVVKLEGGGPSLTRVRSIASAGIGVMGHIGLTPQSETILGGFKTQGRTAAKAQQLLSDALALEAAGCFAIVLEAVPVPVAARITESLTVPTIGIGAGPECDGQVLVYHDLLGLTEGRAPRFVKRYANLAEEIRGALTTYAAEVRSGAYPAPEHTYAMAEDELELFSAKRVQKTHSDG